jgi:ABC-type antimicrobial peptide transport system permease subunit
VPEDVVTIEALLLLVAGVVVGGVVLAFVPAVLATRVRPADALREPT